MLEIVSIELRKAFSYRADFWIGFFIATVARVGMAYFLWKSVFEYSQATVIAGRTFSQMVLYSILAFLVDQVVRATLKAGIVMREIYDGSLTRYLLYPVSVFKFKFSMCFTQSLVGLSQLGLGILFYALVFGWPEAPVFSPGAVALGVVSLFPAMLSFFLIAFVIELTAFWADNVWSLLVMLRFISAFFGGAFLPLELFPERAQQILKLLPFYQMIGVPVNAFMGRLALEDVGQSMLISLAWSALIYGVFKLVWRRGIRQYSGVGI
jgi:ABC-2 type transport system permease protein